MDRFLLPIPGFIPSHIERYPSYWSKGAALFCMIPSVELAFRALGAIVQPKKEDGTPFSLGDRAWYVITNAAGATFYGLCALNLVPYTAIGGALLFTAYSIAEGGYVDSCYSCQIINQLWQNSFGPTVMAARNWVASYCPSGSNAEAATNMAKVLFSREAMHLVGVVVTALFAYRVAPLLT